MFHASSASAPATAKASLRKSCAAAQKTHVGGRRQSCSPSPLRGRGSWARMQRMKLFINSNHSSTHRALMAFLLLLPFKPLAAHSRGVQACLRSPLASTNTCPFAPHSAIAPSCIWLQHSLVRCSLDLDPSLILFVGIGSVFNDEIISYFGLVWFPAYCGIFLSKFSDSDRGSSRASGEEFLGYFKYILGCFHFVVGVLFLGAVIWTRETSIDLVLLLRSCLGSEDQCLLSLFLNLV